MQVKNSTRRLVIRATPSTPPTSSFSHSEVIRYDCLIVSKIGLVDHSGSPKRLSPLAGVATGSPPPPAAERHRPM